MQDHGQGHRDVARWRTDVRRALPGADDDIVDEVAQDVCDRRAALLAAGGTAAEADALACREIAAWRGRPRPQRPMRWRPATAGAGWAGDWRSAVRGLRGAPAFASATIVLTAIAVAATVAAFAIVYGVLWRPLPYPAQDRLAVLWQVQRGEEQQISYPDYADLAALDPFDASTALAGGRASVRVGGQIERVNALYVEPAGLSMLGAQPMAGRLLGAADAGRPVVMISDRLWRRAFASDPAVIGRLMWMSGREVTIAGVLAPGFDFELPVAGVFRLEQHDVWGILDPADPFVTRRDVSSYEALVRLSPGATVAGAQGAADGLAQQLARTYPQTNAERTFRVVDLRAAMAGTATRPLTLALMAAAVTLMIALANLGTLALARLSARRSELAIRQAIGASRFRLARQFVTEHTALAVAGGMLGCAGAARLVRAIADSEAADLPRRDAIAFDAPVWICAAAVVSLIVLALTAVQFQWRGGPLRAHDGERIAGRSSRRFRRLLVAAELALAVALTAGGALLGLSLVRLMAVDPGFTSRGVVAARASAYAERYPDFQQARQFFISIVERLENTAGIARAAAGSSLPLSGQTSGTAVQVEGQPVPAVLPTAGWQAVTPGYFDTLGMRIRRGRAFTADDLAHEGHVTIINEQLARLLFADGDPLGQRVALGGDTGDWHQVVGVVSDVRHLALNQPPAPRAYDLFGEHGSRTMFVIARARGDDAAPVFGMLRQSIAALDPQAPVFEAASMDTLVARSAAPRLLAARMAAGLAGAAVLLAIVGVGAVTAAAVAERTRELGVRAALGATPGALQRMIVGEGLGVAAGGTALGMVGGWMAARLLDTQLYGVARADVPLIVLGAAGGLLVVAVAAALPGARRAAAADPLVAMRD
jgi:putative ABC transport system permease protein